MRYAVLLYLVLACGCATLNASGPRVIGMRTGERVTIVLLEGEGLPSCTLPASNEVTCEFHEEFVHGLSAASDSVLEPIGIACELAMRRVPHTDQQAMTCAWHLQEILSREAKAKRFRDGRE